MYQYEKMWRPYVFPPSEARFATSEDLTAAGFKTVDLRGRNVRESGIPIAKTGSRVVIDPSDVNSIVFGETGSMKSRCVVRSTIYSMAAAKESMIITDPKGELASDGKIRALLEKQGYQLHFMDFRTLRSDRYNLLERPFSLYRRGEVDKALVETSKLAAALTKPHRKGNIDIYWPNSSEGGINGTSHLLYSVYADRDDGEQYVNVKTLAGFASAYGLQVLDEIMDDYCGAVQNCHSVTVLRGLLSASEKTSGNIASMLSTVFQPFNQSRALADMLSGSTFDIADFYANAHCLFLILPDESDLYRQITGILIDMFYSRLIEAYAVFERTRTPVPRGIAWILDEFCNVHVSSMGPKISAGRSRRQRFVLVCQSLHQLEKTFPEEWYTIVGNCSNIIFLKSADPSLLDYISNLCGTTTVSENGREPLVTAGMLRHLRKTRTYKEGIFIKGDLVYRAKFADCDTYDLGLEPHEPYCPIPDRFCSPADSISPGQILSGLRDGKFSHPFKDPLSVAEQDDSGIAEMIRRAEKRSPQELITQYKHRFGRDKVYEQLKMELNKRLEEYARNEASDEVISDEETADKKKGEQA